MTLIADMTEAQLRQVAGEDCAMRASLAERELARRAAASLLGRLPVPTRTQPRALDPALAALRVRT